MKNANSVKVMNYVSEGAVFGTRRISYHDYVLVRSEDVPKCSFVGINMPHDKDDDLWEEFEIPQDVKYVRVECDLDVEVWPDESIRSGFLRLVIGSNLAKSGQWVRIIDRGGVMDDDDQIEAMLSDFKCGLRKADALIDQFKSDGYVKLTSDLFKEET